MLTHPHTHTHRLALAVGALKSTKKGKEKCDPFWGVKCDAEQCAPPLAAPLPRTHTHTRMPPNYNRVCVSVGGWQGKRPTSFEKRFSLGLSPFCLAAPRLTNCLSACRFVIVSFFRIFFDFPRNKYTHTHVHIHLYETRDKTITIKIIYECEDEYSSCHPANLL